MSSTDQTDGGGTSKPERPPSGDDKYQKGYEGYKRWFGEGSPPTSLQGSQAGTSTSKQEPTGRYQKGHEGRRKYYGNPGSPTHK